MKQSDFTMRKKLLSLQPLLKYLLSSILLPLSTSRLKTKIKNSKQKKTSKLLAVIVTRWKRGKEKLSRT